MCLLGFSEKKAQKKAGERTHALRPSDSLL
jgi:hypothetical protein